MWAILFRRFCHTDGDANKVISEEVKPDDFAIQGNLLKDTSVDMQAVGQNSQNPQFKIACEICGLFNHATKDCRKLFCEICGLHNHVTYDCKRCVP
jgi:rRNA maturation endonuclease Nob1